MANDGSHRRQPTIRDVAALARVSHQTVSRVINEKEGVTPETRERVEHAITELAYYPNAIARFMAKGSTRTLICLAPNLIDYTFAAIIEGAEKEAREHGYVLFSSSAEDEKAFCALIEQMIASRRTDGLMVINPYADDRFTHVPPGVPTVFVGARPRAEAVDSVALDDENVGLIATRHLLHLGHRFIAMITGPLAEDCTQDRIWGYEMALREAGVEPDPALCIAGDWSASSGYDAFMQLALSGARPTAVFAQNDRMAIGVIRAARDLGLAVPTELAVIGVDDMPLASYFDPPLTTMRQDLFGIGRKAAQLLIRAVEQPGAPLQHLRIPAELVVRRSTAAPISAQTTNRR